MVWHNAQVQSNCAKQIKDSVNGLYQLGCSGRTGDMTPASTTGEDLGQLFAGAEPLLAAINLKAAAST